jgi:hypothetical protein
VAKIAGAAGEKRFDAAFLEASHKKRVLNIAKRIYIYIRLRLCTKTKTKKQQLRTTPCRLHAPQHGSTAQRKLETKPNSNKR